MKLLLLIPSFLSFLHMASASSAVPKIDGSSVEGDKNYKAPYFPLEGFQNYSGNPILSPNPANEWESTYLYNPSAIVIDDKVFLIYRAQDANKISSLGLAWSDDGIKFTRYDKPIVLPTESYEQNGGVEDPRVIRVNGIFYMTYSAYDGTTARLCMATSTDLVNWKKHGPILPKSNYRPDKPGWSKSGAIINEKQPDGKYYMIYGDQYLYQATSKDLLHWDYDASPPPYTQKRYGFETTRMEPGPAPIKTREGKWILVYNGQAKGDDTYRAAQYSTGELLLDPVAKPHGPDVARLSTPILVPGGGEQGSGQVPDVVFTEGLVQFHGKWYMYFGQSDTTLGVAIVDVQK